MSTHRSTRLLVVALVAVPLGLAACGGKSTEATGGGTSGSQTTEVSGGAASASCAFIVEYDGHNYFGHGVEVAPVAGASLGNGTIPPCDDTGGAGSAIPAEQVEVTEAQGVSPTVAIMLVGRTDVVLLRDDVATGDLPPEIERLTRAPKCDPGDEPIELAGHWLGILAANGETEGDLVPPYDLEVFVNEASSPRYARSYLTIRVTSELGKPLTHEDIRTSLWKGGSVSMTVACRDDRYLAQEVEAHPPA